MTILQIPVDDSMKIAADSLFSSLGLDTPTAVRMFLAAAIKNDDIPFAIKHKADRDTVILEAIARREAGERFYTADEFLANIKAAIAEGAKDART